MNDTDRKRIIESNHALVKNWKPRNVFRFFADLSSIPRESGHVEKVAAFLEVFAAERRLECERDSTGNVIIRKLAQHSSAVEGVILQAHQDMVCVKNAGIDHDFALDPIELAYKEGWLHANGTTLGADDGIGVALALAVLADPDLPHPPLEGLFTVDEETDMKGAKAVLPGSLRGGTLINLDAEDLGIAYVSSAAGVSSELKLLLSRDEAAPERSVFRSVDLEGLLGGHSGIMINEARANAHVLLARFLTAAVEQGMDFGLHSLGQGEGRGADNAIPDRAQALVSLPSEEAARTLEDLAARWTESLNNEYRSSDPGVRLSARAVPRPEAVAAPLDAISRHRLLSVVRLLPLGAFRFIQTDELKTIPYGDLLVETSCNLGILQMKDDTATFLLLARGSTESVLDDLMRRIRDLAVMAGGALHEYNRTPGWEMPAHPTPVQALFQEQGLTCMGVHAGLECGCLVEAFVKEGRNLDAVSVGPDLKDVHSPNERLHVESVQKLWEQLLAVLAAL